MYVDDKFNCEDIALNFVASMLTCEGPLLVRGRDPYVTYDPMGGISRRPGYMQTRSQCLNDFTDVWVHATDIRAGSRRFWPEIRLIVYELWSL
jgi:hypothetical protein